MNDESLIYGIPISDLVVKNPVQLEKGTYYNFGKFNLYVPNEVTSSTSAFIFYPGSKGSGGDYKIINSIINTGNGDQILVIPDDTYRDKELKGSQHLQLIEQIGVENGVEINTINMMGYSAGGPLTFSSLINTIEKNPNSGPHNAVFCDVVDFNVTKEQIDLLKQDNSTLLFFEPNDQLTKFEKDLAAGGVNVIICRTTDGHNEHDKIDDEALMNGIIDFASGKSDTLRNSEIYTFEIYEDGKFREISIEEVAERFKNSPVSVELPTINKSLLSIGELRSENEFLASKVNNIRAAIRNTGFLSGGISDSYSSTTKVPSSLGSLVQDFFGTCSSLLTKIESDTRSIIEIGESIDRLNNELDQDAEVLNDSIFMYTNMEKRAEISIENTEEKEVKSTINPADIVSNVSNVASNIVSDTTEKVNEPMVVPDAKKISDNSANKNNKATGATNVKSSVPSSDYSSNYAPQYQPIVNDFVALDDKIFDNSEFYDFNKLCSNDEYLVYRDLNMGDNCKIVVHYDGNKVTGMEYYFDFETEELAVNNTEMLLDSFGRSDKIIQKDNYVKVVFDEVVYNNLTLDKFKNNFSKLEEVVKE